MLLRILSGCLLALLALTGSAFAQQIVVSNYGIAANGMPYAIAIRRNSSTGGCERQGRALIDGGGTTVRNLLEGSLPYGEIDLAGTVLAIQQGAALKIISDNVLTVADSSGQSAPILPSRH